jgi:hypothetical protein
MYRLSEAQEMEIEERARKNNMRVHFMAQAVGITTNCGAWQLIPTAPNNVKLLHENGRVRTYSKQGINNTYHNQHRNFPNFAQALEYIKCHDAVRYTFG